MADELDLSALADALADTEADMVTEPAVEPEPAVVASAPVEELTAEEIAEIEALVKANATAPQPIPAQLEPEEITVSLHDPVTGETTTRTEIRTPAQNSPVSDEIPAGHVGCHGSLQRTSNPVVRADLSGYDFIRGLSAVRPVTLTNCRIAGWLDGHRNVIRTNGHAVRLVNCDVLAGNVDVLDNVELVDTKVYGSLLTSTDGVDPLDLLPPVEAVEPELETVEV